MSECDLALYIGGPVTSVEHGRKLALAILGADVRSDWNERPFVDCDDVLSMLENASGDVLLLVGRGKESLADGILEVCRDIGLTYNLSVGQAGEDDYLTQRAYHPPWGKEDVAGSLDAQYHISLQDLNDAISKAQASGDLEPIFALRDRTYAAHKQPGKLVVAPGIVNRLRGMPAEAWEGEKLSLAPHP